MKSHSGTASHFGVVFLYENQREFKEENILDVPCCDVYIYMYISPGRSLVPYSDLFYGNELLVAVTPFSPRFVYDFEKSADS